MKSVAIIGGGITGLTAGFELAKHGIPITLYEAGTRVGGPIQTVREGGYLAECGPNTILETSPVITRLIHELGLESRRLYSNPSAANRYIARDGQPVALPDSPGKFISSPLFSAAAKLRLLAEPLIRRSDPSREETVADFVVRRLGREFLDYGINPLVGGVYAGDPNALSVKHAFPKLHALEQQFGSLIAGQFLGAAERKRRGTVSKQNAPKFSFDDGLEVLIRALRERMQDSIWLGRRITRLEFEDGQWTVFSRTPSRKIAQKHSAVIVAIPAHDLARIEFRGFPTPDLSSLRQVYYPPVASVVLGFRREDVQHKLDGFGVLVPEAERMRILGAIFSSTLFPDRAPKGFVTLTTYLGGARSPDLALMKDEALVESAIRDLRTLLRVTGTPTYRHCFVFREAIPQYNVGYGDFKRLMARTEAAAPGLLIGGHCRAGISIGDSIVSGAEMAERTRLYVSDPWHKNISPPQFAMAV